MTTIRWALAGWLIMHALFAFNYGRVWTSDLALWEHAARSAPLKPRPHVNYAKYLIEDNRFDEAVRVMQYVDRLVQLPWVREHERKLMEEIITQNMLLLSIIQDAGARVSNGEGR